MKKITLSILLISSFWISFSQNFDNINIDEDVSYNTSLEVNEGIRVPLYNIETEGGLSVPIYLSYNNKGMKVSDVPSSVGFNWQLHAGGGIEKRINHLVDESNDGWFFNPLSDDYQEGLYYGGSNSVGSLQQGRDLFKSVDAAPDVFNLNMSDGSFAEYVYERTNAGTLIPKILRQDGSLTSTYLQINAGLMQQNGYGRQDYNNVYQDENDSEIKITNNRGVKYLFRKGVKRKRPYDLMRRTNVDSFDYKNYYVHKIVTDFNSEEIKFEYTNTTLNKLIYHNEGTRYQTNSVEQTPPDNSDPIETRGYYEDISVEDVSRKEISKITTNTQVVEFIYKYIKPYYNSISHLNFTLSPDRKSQIESQNFKLLDEIKIYNHNNIYVSGYKFLYTTAVQDEQNTYEGDLKIKRIIKYGRNHKDNYVYKEFNYNYNHRVSAVSKAIDVFGYPNSGNVSGQCYNSEDVWLFCDDKMPNESEMVKGMLKSIVNSNGGKTEYSYKENSFEDMYYGGLLVDKIKIYNNDDVQLSEIQYDYEEPEGFGLAIYDDNQYQQGEIPEGSYTSGYYETGLMTKPWQSYFTKVDPLVALFNYGYLTAYNVYSSPSELMQNTPSMDFLIESMQLQELQSYNQIKSGSFYKKVTKRRINPSTGNGENGYVTSYYRPSLTGFSLNKKLERKEYYNNQNNKIKEDKYNYDVVYNGYLNAYRFDNVHLNTNGWFRYNVKNAPIFYLEDVVKNAEIIEFDNQNNIIKQHKMEYTYFGENTIHEVDYNKVQTELSYINGNIYNKTEYKYLKEYGQIDDLQGMYYKNPLVEKNEWVINNNSNWNLKSSIVNLYMYDGKIENVGYVMGNINTGTFYTESDFVSSYYNQSGDFISLADEFIEYKYNGEGVLISQKNTRTLITEIYQRSNEYEGLYVDAILTTSEPYNGENNFFLKKSFEDSNETGVVKFNNAFSGNYVFSGSSINLGDFPLGYKVSYWFFNANKWTYKSFTHGGGNVIITKPNNASFIDEVRIQPQNSTIQTFTFKPLIGITSKLNERGEGERIEYNIFGSPLYLLDKEGNVLKEFRTNNINKIDFQSEY